MEAFVVNTATKSPLGAAYIIVDPAPAINSSLVILFNLSSSTAGSGTSSLFHDIEFHLRMIALQVLRTI